MMWPSAEAFILLISLGVSNLVYAQAVMLDAVVTPPARKAVQAANIEVAAQTDLQFPDRKDQPMLPVNIPGMMPVHAVSQATVASDQQYQNRKSALQVQFRRLAAENLKSSAEHGQTIQVPSFESNARSIMKTRVSPLIICCCKGDRDACALCDDYIFQYPMPFYSTW